MQTFCIATVACIRHKVFVSMYPYVFNSHWTLTKGGTWEGGTFLVLPDYNEGDVNKFLMVIIPKCSDLYVVIKVKNLMKYSPNC